MVVRLHRIAVAALLPIAIAGCEGPFPPLPDVPEPGTRTEHSLTLEPHRASVCIAKNVDAMEPPRPELPVDAPPADRQLGSIGPDSAGKTEQASPPPLNARIRPGKGSTLVEVHVITRSLLAVVELSVQGAGSRADVWTEWSAPQRRDAFVAAMLAGC